MSLTDDTKKEEYRTKAIDFTYDDINNEKTILFEEDVLYNYKTILN